MTTVKISFDKERLFDRCRTDIGNKVSITSEVKLDVCEHDRAWMVVALSGIAGNVECELSRIARTVKMPLLEEESRVVFEIDQTSDNHAERIAEAIECYIVSKVCENWAVAHGLPLIFGSIENLAYLKHLTLKKQKKDVH